jgi:hypothetical protein
MTVDTKWKKRLIVGEAVVCFAPSLLILLFALFVALPSQLVLALRYGAVESFLFAAIVIGGCLGMGGVWMLLSRYFRKESHLPRRRTIAGCLVVGSFAYVAYGTVFLSSPTLIEVLIYGMPAICAIHILYVTRSCWTSSL